MPPTLNNPSALSTMDFIDVCDTQILQDMTEASSLDSSPEDKFDIKAFFWRNALVFFTVAAIATGIGLGFALHDSNMTERDIKYLMFPGELLIRMLQMLVLPLIISSVITGMSSMNKKAFGKMGLWALGYYALTTFMAVFTGIALVVLIQPGKSPGNPSAPSGGDDVMQTVDAILDLIRNVFPLNLVAACFSQYKTVYSKNESLNNTNLTETSHLNDQMPMPGTSNEINILGILFSSVAFGLILGNMENEGKPLKDIFDCLNKVTMHLIGIVLWFSPVGIIFLVAGQILNMKDAKVLGHHLAMYTLTVITGLIIHSFVTLPIIYVTVTRKNPLRYVVNLLRALSTACGTSSRAVTLPITIHCLENSLNLDKEVTRFMLPTAATMTMDGTALYKAVASIFIAQFCHVDLDLSKIIIISCSEYPPILEYLERLLEGVLPGDSIVLAEDPVQVVFSSYLRPTFNHIPEVAVIVEAAAQTSGPKVVGIQEEKCDFCPGDGTLDQLWMGYGSLFNQSTWALWIWKRLMTVFLVISGRGCYWNMGHSALLAVLSLYHPVATIAATGIPEAGMVTLTILLRANGLPLKGVSLIITVDWMLDRLRTMTNMLGDCIGVIVVQHLYRNKLQRSTTKEKCLVSN